MEFIIVTGLSGAGKSKAIHAMEDIGFYCVDNLPPAMIPVFHDLCLKLEGMPQRVAVVTDTRGGELFKSFFDALSTLAEQNVDYKILYLEASEGVLVNRYQETRRKHPLAASVNGSLEEAVKIEKEILRPVKERADFIINTSNISAQAMKGRVVKLFLKDAEKSTVVHCISFGFKHGIPLEADLLFDVRCLPNPFYIDGLREKTGIDKEVYDFVMDCEETKGFVTRFIDMIDYLLPLYIKEGKSQLVVAIGCTGGHHRSVTLARFLHEHLEKKNARSTISHRDIKK